MNLAQISYHINAIKDEQHMVKGLPLWETLIQYSMNIIWGENHDE